MAAVSLFFFFLVSLRRYAQGREPRAESELGEIGQKREGGGEANALKDRLLQDSHRQSRAGRLE